MGEKNIELDNLSPEQRKQYYGFREVIDEFNRQQDDIYKVINSGKTPVKIHTLTDTEENRLKSDVEDIILANLNLNKSGESKPLLTGKARKQEREKLVDEMLAEFRELEKQFNI